MAYVRHDGHWGDFHEIRSRSTILAQNRTEFHENPKL